MLTKRVFTQLGLSEDSDIFFGREEEIDALDAMAFQTDLLLVFGASGTGKTSLIQCGLASRFQSHDWLALNIRRGSNLNVSFEKALQEAGGTQSDGVTSSHPVTSAADLDWLDEDWTADQPTTAVSPSLSPLTRRLKAIYLHHFKPLYLIFDQFEEQYILGNKAEQDAFIQIVQEILRVEQPVKIILSIREEYLGHLYEFEREVPQLLRKKLRVEPMHLDKVKTVITRVAALPQGNVRLQKGQEAAIATGIFDKIKGKEKTLAIELPYLQVFLDKLYLHITGDESRQAKALFTAAALNSMGNIGDVLRNFLDEQVQLVGRNLAQPAEAIWRILSPFVTLEGTKEPLSTEQLAVRLPAVPMGRIEGALQAFVNSRILRYMENDHLYEIAHDALAQQIHAKRNDEEIAILEVQRLVRSQTALKSEAREFFSEKQLLFIEPYLDKLRLTDAEKSWVDRSRIHVQAQKAEVTRHQAQELERTRQRLRIVWALLITVAARLLAAGYFAIVASRQKNEALEATRQAQISEEEARTAQNRAEKSLRALQREKAQGLIRDGDSFLQNDEPQLALEKYRAALQLMPGDSTLQQKIKHIESH